MIQVMHPEAPTQKYRIHWVGGWIDNIHPLSSQDFICFAEEDAKLYDATILREDFALVILIKDGKIIAMRSLAPCIYTESHAELEATEKVISEVDRQALAMLADNPEYLKIVRKITAAIEQNRV